MNNFNWFNLIISIITALGIFEIIKRILIFTFENNVIKRNLEKREIAQRIFDYCTELKMMHYIEPLSSEQENQLRKDVIKIDQFDKNLGNKIQKLYTNPIVIKTMFDNWKYTKEKEYHKTAIECQNELEELINELLPQMDAMRFEPLIKFKFL